MVTLEDPWLFIGKMHAYAEWWAGSPRTSAGRGVAGTGGPRAGCRPR